MSYDPKQFKYRNGLGTTSAYQVSGIPFATGSLDLEASSGSALKVSFPHVTRWVSIINRSSQHVRVGFSKAGTEGTNYFTIHEDNHPTNNMFELKVKEIYLLSHGSAITNQVDVVAGLTSIHTSSLPTNWSGSAGVG